MTALEILRDTIYIPETLILKPRPYNDRFVIVEIETSDKIPFKLYYYIVDLEEQKVYYGGYEVPDGVNVSLIERGREPHIKKPV